MSYHFDSSKVPIDNPVVGMNAVREITGSGCLSGYFTYVSSMLYVGGQNTRKNGQHVDPNLWDCNADWSRKQTGRPAWFVPTNGASSSERVDGYFLFRVNAFIKAACLLQMYYGNLTCSCIVEI